VLSRRIASQLPEKGTKIFFHKKIASVFLIPDMDLQTWGCNSFQLIRIQPARKKTISP
jgi:hypothetical protein